jgi:hypothetical protein
MRTPFCPNRRSGRVDAAAAARPRRVAAVATSAICALSLLDASTGDYFYRHSIVAAFSSLWHIVPMRDDGRR